MARPAKSGSSNRFRLVSGAWRGRRLQFPSSGDVRPTPDRVRETLFNWIGPAIHGQRALDLFAGSGALGLEGLSRGLREAVFVERDRRLAAALKGHLELLEAEDRAHVRQMDVRTFLKAERPQTPFDLVFLDPPYDAGLHAPVLQALDAGPWLAPEANIYIEYRARATPPALPETWHWHRQSKAGEVGFGLARRSRAGNGG